MEKLEIVVVGSLHHNTLGVVRSLGEAGLGKENIFALLVGNGPSTKNLISESKYIDPERIAFVESFDGIVTWLKNQAHFEEKRVVICCTDGASEAVISSKNELQGKYITPSTSINISELMIKSSQAAIAVECGLTVPHSMDFDICQDIVWDDFPCIIKPYKSAMGFGKDDIHIVKTREEFKDVLKQIKADRIQIQQYIHKEMEYQLIGCAMDSGTKVIIPGFTRILRQPKNTNTGYLIYSPIEELKYNSEAVRSFLKRIGYNGLFSVEFVRGDDGKDYFLEINMRNDGNAYCVESAGVNLPYIWSYYQTFRELPDRPITFSEPVYFLPDFNDLKVAFKDIGLYKWIRQFRQAQSHSIYNKQDMGPFRYEFWRQVKRVLLNKR